MFVRVLKPFSVANRIFEHGYEVNTVDPAYGGMLDGTSLINDGLAEEIKPVKIKLKPEISKDA